MLPVRSVPISCPARSPLRSPVIRPHRIACISACLAVFLVCLFGILPAQAASIPLFGTVEFRRPLDSLPAWAEVRRMNELEPIFVSGKVFHPDRHLGFLQTGGAGQKRHGTAALCQHVLEPLSLP